MSAASAGDLQSVAWQLLETLQQYLDNGKRISTRYEDDKHRLLEAWLDSSGVSFTELLVAFEARRSLAGTDNQFLEQAGPRNSARATEAALMAVHEANRVIANRVIALIELQEEQPEVDTPGELEFQQELAYAILAETTNLDVDMLDGQSSLTETPSGARVPTSLTPGTTPASTQTAPVAGVLPSLRSKQHNNTDRECL